LRPALALLMRRLDTVTVLERQDREILGALPIEIAAFEDNHDIVREGEHRDRCFVVLKGLIGSYKLTGEGARQIPSFYVPGDMPDMQSIHLSRMDVGFRTLMPCRIGFVSHAAIRLACAQSFTLIEAFWRMTLIDASIFREWLTNIGQRNALARLAHVFCELFVRLKAVGLVPDHSFDLPLTQQELGDAIGTSSVHVNRVLQELRKEGLIVFREGRLTIPDWSRLTEVGDFDPAYLHLRETGRTVGTR
jgi:CRP-like cAMP-binding protein